MRETRETKGCETCTAPTSACYPVDAAHRPEDYVWSTSEEAKLRSFSLWIIQSIVERHGGTVDIDLATDTLSIDVPAEKQADCAMEIEEQVGHMCY